VNIKVFNKLPVAIEKLVQDKNHFILALKRVLIVESFIHLIDIYIPKIWKKINYLCSTY